MKFYYSKVPIEIFLKCLRNMEADVDIEKGGAIAHLPTGGVVYFWFAEDQGVKYSFLRVKERDIKFIQRVFSRANLMLKEMKVQPQSQSQEAEVEEKEERKKGTDEVSEFVSGTSDSVHGGDSASGEVPEVESGRGQDPASSGEHALPQEAGSMQEEDPASPSDASSLSPDHSSSFEEEGESGASDRSELERASEGEGSSGDGACPKSLECASSSQVEGRDASEGGQAPSEEGTGSFALYLDSSSEGLLDEILREELDEEPGEQSTLPPPSGAEEGEASEPEREVSPSLSFKELKKIMSRGQEVPSTHVRYSFGGVFADLESQGIPPRELIARARRAFARLVSEYGEGNEGPRWDYRKISARIASYQNWRVSDRKKEVGRPAIAVLPDVSGSMSAFAEQVLELSKALMALGVPGAEVIVIVQSNGYPLELWANGKKLESFDYYGWDEGEQVFGWYREIFRRWDVRVVILAADWDGEWLYSQIAESITADIYWLDVYLSSKVYPTLVRQFPPRWASGIKWSVTAARKVRYVYGCRDALDFVRGLELAIRNKK